MFGPDVIVRSLTMFFFYLQLAFPIMCIPGISLDLPDGRLPRRSVHHLRHGSLVHQRTTPREQNRPHVEGLP
jgi:hypothetical protein